MFEMFLYDLRTKEKLILTVSAKNRQYHATLKIDEKNLSILKDTVFKGKLKHKVFYSQYIGLHR